ncbi:MAG TPA: hypothetical protein PKY81_09160 [bacterium]|nr:hypothetical protein [bacterium]
MKDSSLKFISITPNGFHISNVNIRNDIIFTVSKTSKARKFWRVLNDKRFLACFSSDGINSSKGAPCSSCLNKQKCIPKFRLFFSIFNSNFCLELNPDSYQNFLDYTNKLNELNLSIFNVRTRAFAVERDYWSNIFFELIDSPA